MAFEYLGPATIVVGNPTTALGAGMKVFDSEDTTVNLGIRSAHAGRARTSGVASHTGLYRHAPNPEVTISLTDADVENLKAFVASFTLTTATGKTALGLGDELTKIDPTTVPTIGIIPQTQIALGVDAPNAIWLPAGLVETIDGIQMQQIGDGEQKAPFNVRIRGVKRAQSQAGTNIPAGARIAFIGPPGALGLTWSLPANL